MDSEKVLIIDNDCGVDDALAIILAMQSKCKILAFTTCRGNTSAPNAAANVMRLTNHCRRTEIPVYVGCTRPLVDNQTNKRLSKVHGEDGFGGVASQFSTGDQEVQSEHACMVMTELAAAQPGQITLVALGPLTNLAVAQRLDPNFESNLKEVLIMGGNFDGIGNTTVGAEFNFFTDPEAAFTVFNEFKCPITVFTWEACIRSLLPWDWYDKWVSHETHVGHLVNQLLLQAVAANRAENYPEGIQLPDLQAIAVLFWPELVIEDLKFPVTVETGGNLTRGMMVVDRRSGHKIHYLQETGNVRVVCKLDVPLLGKHLMRMTEEDWVGDKQ